MSQLDQAKKEAKRLFNLAKANQEVNINTNMIGTSNNKIKNVLEVENLSKAREIVSLINGYKNWHEYENVLKKKDLMLNNVDKSSISKENRDIYDNQKEFIQDIDFNIIKTPVTDTSKEIIFNQEHKLITLGKVKTNSFLNSQMKSWILHDYPLLVSGSAGSGKTETLLSMSSQYIENKEGVIYFDGKGDNILYSKMFGYAVKFNRLDDLYCINFMTGSKLPIEENNNPETLSHSIDPINPMLGNAAYFDLFFGRMGKIIYSILEEIHDNKQLMDTKSLKSILMLNNLIAWHKNKKFKTEEISKYLLELDLDLDWYEENAAKMKSEKSIMEIELEDHLLEKDLESALLKHTQNSYKALEFVKLLETYSYVFKANASVNMENIFLQRKILLIMLPAFEKSPDYLILLGEILTEQISYIDNKYQKYGEHLQNVIMDEFMYFGKSIEKIDFNKTRNNYIFGCQDYYEAPLLNYVIANAKTKVIKKMNSPDLPKSIKLEIIDNIIELNKIPSYDKNNSFMKNLILNLKDQRETTAYVLCNNTYESDDANVLNNKKMYFFDYITCEYLPAKYEKKIYLVKHNQREIEIEKPI